VIEHCGLIFIQRGATAPRTDRLVYLGDDPNGVALEVMAVEVPDGSVLVIHAMRLRTKYRFEYQEAQRWRR